MAPYQVGDGGVQKGYRITRMISTSLPIETPEGITFTYELASLADRGKAYAIDLLIRAVAVFVIGILLMLLLGPLIKAGLGLWMIIAFVVEWFYYVVFEMAMDGQSIGKRLLGLRVVKVAGHPIGFYDSVLRNLLRAADIMPLTYAAGALSVMFTRRFQRLGDLAAGTIVVHERKTWFGSRQPHIDPRLAQGGPRGIVLSNRERRLLQEFALRKDRLHPERREQLAEILAEPYRRRFGMPEQGSATDTLVKLHVAASEERRSPAAGGESRP